MKIDEVPQDEAFLIEGKIRDLCYAVDKDGILHAGRARDGLPKNEAMKLAWNAVFETCRRNTQKSIGRRAQSDCFLYGTQYYGHYHTGELYRNFQMESQKRHLKMKNFSKINLTLMVRYAEVLNITPAELVDTERIREIVIEA